MWSVIVQDKSPTEVCDVIDSVLQDEKYADLSDEAKQRMQDGASYARQTIEGASFPSEGTVSVELSSAQADGPVRMRVIYDQTF